MSELNLGKSGRIGKFDLDKIKSGIKKEDVANNEQLKALFDILDDGDGTLSRKEIEKLKTIFDDVNTDKDKSTLSEKEAKNITDKNGNAIGKENGKLFLQLLSNIMNKAEQGVKNVSLNNNEDEVVTYEDGRVETIHKDGSKTITKGNITTELNSEGKKIKETVTDNGKVTQTEFDEKENVKKETKSDKEGNTEEIIYNNGEPIKKTVTNQNIVKEFSFDKEKQEFILKKSIDNGSGATTVFEGNKKTITQDNKKSIYNGDTLESEEETETLDNGSKKVTKKEYKDGHLSQTTITLDVKKQQVIKNGYTVNYDGDGYITGVIVQNGEGIRTIAKKFGCSVEDLLKANAGCVKGKSPNYYFLVGQEIRIPDMDTDSFIEINSTRKSAAETTQDYNNYVAQKRAEEEAKAKAEGEARAEAEDAKNRKEVEEQTSNGTEIAQNLYNDMKGIGTRKEFPTHIDSITEENVAYVVLGYNTISSKESLAEAILDEIGLGNVTKRLGIIEGIFNKLTVKAESLGIDTAQYKTDFEKAKQSAYSKAINNENFDNIFKALATVISASNSLTNSEKTEVENMTYTEKQEQTVSTLEQVAQEAELSFDDQLKQDGWAGDFVDWFSGLWGSKNRAKLVKADLDTFNSQVEQLKACKSEAEFKAKFKEIFKVDYNASLVLAYQNRTEKQAVADATYSIEQNFNSSLKVLLSKENLTNETQYVQTSSGMYGGATGQYIETATKEQVYEREFNAFAEFLGQGNIEDGKKKLEDAFAKSNITESSSLEEKWTVLHNIAKNYSEVLHNNVLEATENQGYDAFSQKSELMYNAAFGTTNDIARRVQEYNISQQSGAMVLKSVVKGGAAIGLCLVPGVGLALAAAGTAVISAGVDISDRVTSEVGLQDGEIEQILKNAAIDGATVFAGGQLTKMLKNASTFAKLGGQFVGDVAVGAAAEKLQTGTITLGGVAFQCVFSAAGNLIALKQIKNASEKPKMGIEEPANHSFAQDQAKKAMRQEKAEADKHAGYKRKEIQAKEKLAEDMAETPITEEEIEAFRKSLKEAPTPEEKAAIIENNRKVAEAYAKSHQLGENLSDDVIAKLTGSVADAPVTAPKNINPEITALENNIKGLEGNIKRLEQQIAGAKKMGKNTAKLEETLRTNQEKLTGKLAELDNSELLELRRKNNLTPELKTILSNEVAKRGIIGKDGIIPWDKVDMENLLIRADEKVNYPQNIREQSIAELNRRGYVKNGENKYTPIEDLSDVDLIASIEFNKDNQLALNKISEQLEHRNYKNVDGVWEKTKISKEAEAKAEKPAQTPKVKKDVNTKPRTYENCGKKFVDPEDYNLLTNDELLTEYQKLYDFQHESRVYNINGRKMYNHDTSTDRAKIKEIFKQRNVNLKNENGGFRLEHVPAEEPASTLKSRAQTGTQEQSYFDRLKARHNERVQVRK